VNFKKRKTYPEEKKKKKTLATIISFELCALNADLQHFISRFNKIFLLYGYP
jgi:hypothetical protein